jgi:hypothetical protein
LGARVLLFSAIFYSIAFHKRISVAIRARAFEFQMEFLVDNCPLSIIHYQLLIVFLPFFNSHNTTTTTIK